MKKQILIAGVAAALMAGGWMGLEHQQPEGEMPAMDMMDPAAMMKMMDAMSKPDAPEHAMIKKMEGEWVITAKFVMEPGSDPEVSVGTSTNTLVLGGRQLMSDVDLSMKFGGMDYPFKGMGMMGFDKSTKQFQSTWVDTMNTNQLRQVGELDGETIVVTGSSKNEMWGESSLRNVISFVEGGYDMQFWEKNAMTGGEYMNTGVIEYRRKP